MRVLICGGRDFTDTSYINNALDNLHRQYMFDAVIDGDARGVDSLAGSWARARNIANIKFPADWAKHGRAAGHIRNKQMLDEGKPDMVIAFPGGKGTANMCSIAAKTGIPVLTIGY